MCLVPPGTCDVHSACAHVIGTSPTPQSSSSIYIWHLPVSLRRHPLFFFLTFGPSLLDKSLDPRSTPSTTLHIWPLPLAGITGPRISSITFSQPFSCCPLLPPRSRATHLSATSYSYILEATGHFHPTLPSAALHKCQIPFLRFPTSPPR